jgi:hypothetical protein
MSEKQFNTTKDLVEKYGISEVTQWRDRFPRGPLEYYRLAGKIKYSPEQLERYLEAKRVGADKSQMVSAAA